MQKSRHFLTDSNLCDGKMWPRALDKLYAIKEYNAKGLIKGLIQRNETEYAFKLTAKTAYFQTCINQN